MSGQPVDASAVLTIDLAALSRNWRKLRDRVWPAECAAVVKANAYGLGIDQVVPALAQAGCRSFFVAHVSEGILARAALGPGTRSFRIFVLNGLQGGALSWRDYVEHGLIPVLGSTGELQDWAACASGNRDRLPAALHIDTGMNRLGFSRVGDAQWLAANLPKLAENLRIELLMSHFIAAEEPENPFNARQIAEFATIMALLPGMPASLANSSGIFLPQRPFHRLVRPGYALYGGNPIPDQPNPMEAVVQLHARIQQVRQVNRGATAGYGAAWTAQRGSRLATIGVGYADGFPRGAGHLDARPGGARALVLGQPCKIVGRVSMDLMVIDVTDVPETNVVPGQVVELIGPNIGIDALGSQSGTFGYEILTSLGQRYHRAYLNG